MNVRRILLTGDDGYHSVGTRLLIRVLKHDFEIAVAGTNSQQSGVGGKLSVMEGGTWGEDTVDGAPALWTSGSPADTIECAQAYFDKPFDLIISGINLGANVGGAIISSGTYAAAYRGLAIGIAPRAMVLSWLVPAVHFFRRHHVSEDLTSYLAYPGNIAGRVIRYSLQKKMWSCDLLNINFPALPSTKMRFTRFLHDMKEFYSYPLDLDRTSRRFSFPAHLRKQSAKPDLSEDTGALSAGYISITPCNRSPLNTDVFKKVQDKEITLP